MTGSPPTPDGSTWDLVQRGIEAETAGHPALAHELYGRAWDVRRSDLDAAMAAHYVARGQDAPREVLVWNERALAAARRADPAATADWLPSLHLNLGAACEGIGDDRRALEHYRHAIDRARALRADQVQMFERAVAGHVERVAARLG